MYDLGGKLVNGIKSKCVNSIAYVRVKGGESKCFGIHSGVSPGCIVTLALQCMYGRSDEGGENEE